MNRALRPSNGFRSQQSWDGRIRNNGDLFRFRPNTADIGMAGSGGPVHRLSDELCQVSLRDKCRDREEWWTNGKDIDKWVTYRGRGGPGSYALVWRDKIGATRFVRNTPRPLRRDTIVGLLSRPWD